MALPDDDVELRLGGDTLKIVENYEIRSAILTQPAGFALRLGHGGVLADLLSRYPNRTPFTLHVNGQQLQTGYTDAKASGGDEGSKVTLRGRDIMGALMSACAPADRSFSNLSYHRLVSDVLDAVGLREHLLIGTDAANRSAIAGKQIVETTPSELEVTKRANAEIVTDGKDNTRKSSERSITLKVGGKWFDFLKTQLDRAGLFLWASGEGAFILAVPTPFQKPAYQITRIQRGEQGLGKVVDHDFEDNVENRFTKMVVNGRGGGRKHGRTKHQGIFVDPEMVEIFGGEDRKILTVHDSDVKDLRQANHYARRQMSELNREGYRLAYTLAGHSTITRDGTRAIWTPNTVVEVNDRELNIEGNFWIEEVSMKGTPHRTTTVRLMRPSDMFFALEAA